MNIFNLPDLGEGLQDAELIEWKVEEGDQVRTDQLIAIVETAKAVVELPSPQDGIISRLFAKPGDTVEVGAALVAFDSDESIDEESSTQSDMRESVSVVGNLESSNAEAVTEQFYFGGLEDTQRSAPRAENKPRFAASAPPLVAALARQLGLSDVLERSDYSAWTSEKLLQLYASQTQEGSEEEESGVAPVKLTGARKVMAQTMTKSHQHVPAVTLFDDADIGAWETKQDITLRLIRALIKACKKVPLLNAWFDEEEMSIQPFEDVHLGVAVNTEEGLYVPVIRQVQRLDTARIRTILDKHIAAIKTRQIKPQKLLGATISLSNFGTLAGRYATPIIVPPQVAILGAGKIHQLLKLDGERVAERPVLPLSLSFDHRAASGAEAALFLQTVIQDMQRRN